MFHIPKPKDFDELVIMHGRFAHLLDEQRCAALAGKTHDSGMLDSIEDVLLGGCGMFREFAREQIFRISDDAKSVNELREGLLAALSVVAETNSAELDAAGWIIFRLCEERIEQLIERLVCEFNERGPEMRALLRRFMLTGG